MSNPKENQSPKKTSDYIGINESGELVVTDPKLAESLQELSPEELEQIAGGDNNCTNINCPCTTSETSQNELQAFS